jgi:hypothetical protein
VGEDLRGDLEELRRATVRVALESPAKETVDDDVEWSYLSNNAIRGWCILLLFTIMIRDSYAGTGAAVS